MGESSMSIAEARAQYFASLGQGQGQAPQAQDSIAQKILSMPIQSQQSILGGFDRFKYGFSDDFGKKQLIKNATGKDAITLKNGEFGVEDIDPVSGRKVIRPVDPKGFQISDLPGDLTESVGKLITNTGGILGGVVGSLGSPVGTVVGSGLGSAVGEGIRQKIGETLGVRQKGIQKEDLGEIAFEGTLGSLAEGVGILAPKMLRGLGQQIMKQGETKLATNAVEQGVQQGMKEMKPTALKSLNEGMGLPKDTNEIFLKEFIDPNGAIKHIPHEYVVNDYYKDTVGKMVNIVENGQKIANEQYGKLLQQANIDTATTRIKIDQALNTLQSSIDDIVKKDVTGSQGQLLNQLETMKSNMVKTAKDGTITLDESKMFKSALNDVAQGQYSELGQRTKFTQNAMKPLAALLQTEKTQIPALREIDKIYGPQRKAIEKVQKLMRFKSSEGMVEVGRSPQEMMIKRLGNELQGRKLDELIKASDVLSKSEGFKDLAFKEPLMTSIFADKLYSESAKTGWATNPANWPEAVGKTLFRPVNRAKMLKGLINARGVSVDQLESKTVSKLMPKLNALGVAMNVDNPAILKDAVKNLSKKSSKAKKRIDQALSNEIVKSTVARTAKQSATRSLNATLFGDTNGSK